MPAAILCGLVLVPFKIHRPILPRRHQPSNDSTGEERLAIRRNHNRERKNPESLQTFHVRHSTLRPNELDSLLYSFQPPSRIRSVDRKPRNSVEFRSNLLWRNRFPCKLIIQSIGFLVPGPRLCVLAREARSIPAALRVWSFALEQEIGPPRTLRASQSGVQTDPEPGVGSSRPRKRRWLWLPIALVLIYVAWHFYASRGKGQSQDPAAASGGRAAIQSVPVAVTTAQIGDLPVFFNGLGSVTALNTVTVRTRVDGQLINVAFREGQFVHPGDLLAQIDPRPFQVQLEQAEGQLARDAAQLHDANVN
jgi:hypothetical protein